MYGTYHIEWDVFATSIKKTSFAENTFVTKMCHRWLQTAKYL
jgi:hypothetical protein